MTGLTNYRRKNPFFLAPMAGVTDKPLRSFMREMGCGIITSELISARALQDNNQRSLRLMEFSEDQRPYGIQIFGEDPVIIGEGAKRAEGFGADFIDLNLGCPVNKIVKKGAGSALLKDLKKLRRVLQTLKSHVQIPVSLKIRTGWNEQNRNADQVAHIAYEEGFSWMSIHGRTRSQGYSGKADWLYIKEVASRSSIPIVGNGDLISGLRAYEALRFSQCEAVMIGRGCLNDPWIFLEALELFHSSKVGQKSEKQSLDGAKGQKPESPPANGDLALQPTVPLLNPQNPAPPPFKKDFKQAIDKLKNHLENFYDERMFLLQLKKFSAWFSSGFPCSTEFRKNIFQEKDRKALLQKIDEFFSYAQNYEKPAPLYEPFLLQGHG